MKTLKDIEKEIVAEFEKQAVCFCATCKLVGWERTASEILRAALSRVAEQTKEAVMPKERTNASPNDDAVGSEHRASGHNSCRSQMEQNFKSFTE